MNECKVCLLPTGEPDSYCCKWCATRTPEDAERISNNERGNRNFEQWRTSEAGVDYRLGRPSMSEIIEEERDKRNQ